MIDCPTHGPVDGLFCVKCQPSTPRNPPIPAAAKARIDAILRKSAQKRDREADDGQAAIEERST